MDPVRPGVVYVLDDETAAFQHADGTVYERTWQREDARWRRSDKPDERLAAMAEVETYANSRPPVEFLCDNDDGRIDASSREY